MQRDNSIWQQYQRKLQMEVAAAISATQEAVATNYGDEVYNSPILASPKQNEQLFWQVTKLYNKFNVFSVQKERSKTIRHFAASFLSFESAQKFALEMLLVCTKTIDRHGLVKSF